MSELIDREMYPPVGAIVDGLLTLELAPGLPSGLGNTMNLLSMEVAESWPPFVFGGMLYAYVPFFAVSGDPKSGARTDRMGYLAGASRDNGASWRFIAVTPAMPADQVNRLVPDDGLAPRPVSQDVTLTESPFERSRWLETVERRFAPVEGSYVYFLRLTVRRNVETPIEVTVRYDDPADREQPAESRVTLAPGQTELRWQSPVVNGFEAGQTYHVAIRGINPESGGRVFELAEVLLFQPTREDWLSVAAQPAEAAPAN